jgi:hypothetical protein
MLAKLEAMPDPKLLTRQNLGAIVRRSPAARCAAPNTIGGRCDTPPGKFA